MLEVDTITAARRSDNMRRIQSKGTAPEMAVRRLVHSLGYRYRLHDRRLPGNPDLVFPSRRKVVLVHGCFWHQHVDEHCRIVREPKSNRGYWVKKLARNVERDSEQQETLAVLGWDSMIVWECEIERDLHAVGQRIREFLDGESNGSSPPATVNAQARFEA